MIHSSVMITETLVTMLLAVSVSTYVVVVRDHDISMVVGVDGS